MITPKELIEVLERLDVGFVEKVRDYTIKENEVVHIDGNGEKAYGNLNVDGRMVIRGIVFVYEELNVKGELDVVGELHIGGVG